MALAYLVSFLLFGFLSIVVFEARHGQTDNTFFILEAAVVALSWYVFHNLSRKERIRRSLKKKPFPAEWRTILESSVAFYNGLGEEERHRFEYEILCFISEKRITGIKTEPDDTDRLLVAASAVIPIFGFPEWEYKNLSEVLLYPNSFRHDFAIEGKERNISGMVGSGFMNGIMVLSKPDLRNGFLNASDKQNVGIHEFVHLIDKTDGAIDGIPGALAGREYAYPWLDLIADEVTRIKKGKSDINPYGATNREEFLAVASEYFFERPDMLREKHPDLYRILAKVFRQDLKSRFSRMVLRLFGKKQAIGRNDPCPCGSGLKFKKCCGELQ